jgi:uncharacterized protein YdhG (YjbR/CyaY superfamily)
MPARRAATVAEYIKNAAPVAQPHLRKLRSILRSVAPDAEETIKWGVPFFVEPRFLFSFAAFKTYCVLVPTPAALAHFEKELSAYQKTRNFLKLPYAKPIPEALIRRIAKWRMKNLGDGEGFW